MTTNLRKLPLDRDPLSPTRSLDVTERLQLAGRPDVGEAWEDRVVAALRAVDEAEAALAALLGEAPS